MKRQPLLSRWVTPGARLLGGVVLALGFATARPSVWALTAAAFFLLAVIQLAAPPPRRWQGRLAVALLGSSVVLLPFALGGDMERLGQMLLRTTTATLAAVAMSLSIRGTELSGALESLRAPRAIAQMVAHTTAQLGSIASEGKRLVLARKLRGARGTSANLELMSSLLIRCAERAERRALASELRGSSATRTARALGGPGSALFLGSCLVLALGAHWMAR